MAKKSGNGKQGGDLVVELHSAVVDLQQALTRHHRETQDTLARHHEETDRHLGRVSRMLIAVGDRLGDHERRLAAVEAKIG